MVAWIALAVALFDLLVLVALAVSVRLIVRKAKPFLAMLTPFTQQLIAPLPSDVPPPS